MKNLELVDIPNFGGDYLISECGRVFSAKNETLKEMTPFGSPSNQRVTLWRNGGRYRPLIRTLLDRTFGSAENKPSVTDNFLLWYLGTQYNLSEKEIQEIITKQFER